MRFDLSDLLECHEKAPWPWLPIRPMATGMFADTLSIWEPLL